MIILAYLGYLEPPVNQNDFKARITPKISILNKVWTFPLLGSGFSSSRILPQEMTISKHKSLRKFLYLTKCELFHYWALVLVVREFFHKKMISKHKSLRKFLYLKKYELFHYWGSGFSCSRILPWEMTISWSFTPEKLPWTAWCRLYIIFLCNRLWIFIQLGF